MNTREMSPGQAQLLADLRDAKRIRDAAGSVIPGADALLARCEAGDFPSYADAIEPDMSGDEVHARPSGGAKAGNQFGTFQVKWATQPQVRYIARLLRDRDLSKVSDRAAEVIALARPQIEAGNINKKHASTVLDILTSLPAVASPSQGNAAKGDPNSNRRANKFGGKCIHCGVYVQANAGWLTKNSDGRWASEHQSGQCPTQAEIAATPATHEWTVADSGIYRTATDAIYKVYTNQARTRMLAKLLVIERDDDGNTTGASFEYAGMAERFVTPDQKMTLEQAKEFGAIYGVCCKCGALLTDEGSISAGIGPTCAKKGW